MSSLPTSAFALPPSRTSQYLPNMERAMSRLPGESWESFAERRIRQAQAAGEFDRLPGFGQPIPGIDEPWDENSWVREKLKREQISDVPPVLAARLDRQRTLESLDELAFEAGVRQQLLLLNERIRKAHFAHQPGPADGVLPVDIESEVLRWRQKRPQSSDDSSL